jgi:hypothetical protein
MKKRYFFSVCFLIFYSLLYGQNKTKYINEKINVDSLNIPISQTTYYFPISIFDTRGSINLKLSQYLDNWYSRMLFNFKEPLLYNKIEDKEVYRFLWLRRFNKPVSIRIEKINNSIKLYVKVSDGMGGSNTGNVIINKVKEINNEQWNTFINKIESIHFWKLPVEEFKELDQDNSEWILEGSTKSNYHFVTRTSPNEYKLKFFKECCEYLLTLGEINSSK